MVESESLAESCCNQLEEIKDLIMQLSPEEFSTISPVFKNSSIGQHVRHILEFFECLVTHYAQGEVNYHLRKRDGRLESDSEFALQKIREIQVNIQKPDIPLKILQEPYPTAAPIGTTYQRELLYNLEHCVHHQALIRLACHALSHIFIPEDFGIAKSTITFRSKVSKI